MLLASGLIKCDSRVVNQLLIKTMQKLSGKISMGANAFLEKAGLEATA